MLFAILKRAIPFNKFKSAFERPVDFNFLYLTDIIV